MDRAEANRMFQEADSLFRAGRLSESLQLLDALDRAFPNNRRVLYPRALCLHQLGRTGEALELCDVLIDWFDYDHAKELKEQIESSRAVFPAVSDAELEFQPKFAPVAFEPERSAMPWIVGIVAVVSVLIVAPLVVVLAAGSGSGAESPLSDRLISARSSDYVFAFLIGWFLMFWLTFIALRFVGKLPYETFLENALDITLMSFVFTLVSIVPILGFIAYLVIASKKYELTCGELFLFFVIQVAIVAGVILAAVMAAVFLILVP